jgi:hypothetical protein
MSQHALLAGPDRRTFQHILQGVGAAGAEESGHCAGLDDALAFQLISRQPKLAHTAGVGNLIHGLP